MRLALVLCGLVTALVALSTAPAQQDPYRDFVAKTDPRTPEEEKKAFHLPPGFEIELVASEPAIGKPINMNFDHRGRLWITQSYEYPYPAASGRTPRDSVKILSDFSENGKARQVTTFAEGLNIPIGVLPIPGGAIVHSIPNIYRISGEDKETKREVLYAAFGSADTHGMTGNFVWGLDGWVYACHGFFNTSTVKAKDGSQITMNSGNTYRIKPDGSHIEQFTWGQVNPFGLVFDPLGNLYSADCHTKPVMMLLRGAYYQSFGKPDDGLGFAPEMCAHDHGSTAICGIAYYDADQFPQAYRDTIYIGNVVTNRINHDRLSFRGSSPTAVLQPDFLSCDDPWFRPVDIKLGPDGALYVADFYNRIIGHYEVPLNHAGRDRERGRIWRIVYKGADAKKPTMPRADWSKASTSDLVSDLGHSNMLVRNLATHELVARGKEATADVVSALRKPSNANQRAHGLWVLDGLGSLDDNLLAEAARDADRLARVHAMKVLANRATLSPAQRQLLVTGLSDMDGFVRRSAADGIGRHPGKENISPLLDIREELPKDDPQLLHTVRMALRDQFRSPTSWVGIPPANWTEPDQRIVADIAPGVPLPEAAAYLLLEMGRFATVPAIRRQYTHHIARYGTEAVVKDLIVLAKRMAGKDLREQAGLFQAIQQGTQERGSALPLDARAWAETLTEELLNARQSDLVVRGAEMAGSLHFARLAPVLDVMATQRARGEGQRKALINAALALDAKTGISTALRVVSDPTEGAGLREHAAQALASLNKAEAQAELIKVLAVAPAQLQNQIAFALANTPQGGEKLLEAVSTGKASPRILVEWGVNVRLNKFPALKERLTKLTQGMPSADEKLGQMIRRRLEGFAKAKTSPDAGAKVFEKSCATCHQISGVGAKIGPQLDGIGNRGLERILEDIIDPNRNVDQAFRATTLVLKTEQIVSGLVLREEGEVIVLADATGKEQRVSKNQVAERSVTQLSPMPGNLVDQIPEEDFYHLIAFLMKKR